MSNSYINPFGWDFTDDKTIIYVDKNIDKGEIQEAIEQAMADLDIKLEGQDLLYKLMVNGQENGTINIPKDQFLKSASYDTATKKFAFVVGDNTIEVNAADMFDGLATSEDIDEINQKNETQDAELANKVDSSALDNLATKTELQTLETKVDAIVIPDTSNFAIKSDVTEEINNAIANKADKSEIPNVEGFAVKSEVSNEINAVSDSLATFEQQVETALDAKADKSNIELLATKTELQSVDAKIPDVSGFAVKTEVTEEINNAVDGLNQTLADKANADDVYTKTESNEMFQLAGDYVPLENYNELVRKFTTLENYLNVFIKEREEKMDEIINNMDENNKEVIIETPMESIVVPEAGNNAYVITAPLADNSTVELTSPKYMTLINTSDEPVSTSIGHTFVEGESTSATTVYLAGEFDTLTLENVSPSVKSGYDAATVNNVVISENNVKNLTLALDIQDGATITNNSNTNITIQDKNDLTTTLTIVAPNSTVTLNGTSYNVLNAIVSDNTLIIKKNVSHINELNVSQGNVIVEVARQSLIAEKIGEYTIAEGYTVDYLHDEIDSSNISNLTKEGTHILTEDIAKNGNFSVGTFSTDDMIWELNGHSITSSNTRGYGIFRLRGSAHLEINDSVGTGIVKNTDDDYGLWTGTVGSKLVINGGNFEAATHVLYAEKGTIEVNGGTFKLTNWETADKDENGNLRFLLNCHDADYVSGDAKIIVRGGKFYDFDPANCAAEGVGTSFVAEGYGSVMTTEIIDGVEHRVYEVKPIYE